MIPNLSLSLSRIRKGDLGAVICDIPQSLLIRRIKYFASRDKSLQTSAHEWFDVSIQEAIKNRKREENKQKQNAKKKKEDEENKDKIGSRNDKESEKSKKRKRSKSQKKESILEGGEPEIKKETLTEQGIISFRNSLFKNIKKLIHSFV